MKAARLLSIGHLSMVHFTNKGHAKVVELLLQKGSNPNLKNAAGKSCLTLAAEGDHQDAVNLLLEAFDDQESIEDDDVDEISR
jgi:ankyrin repeat protein